MNEYTLQLFSAVLHVIALLIAGTVTCVVVPWLKEKQLYSRICTFVRAAEKLGDVGSIPKKNKKSYVVELLEDRGVLVTPEVDAMIESAVEELEWLKTQLVDVLV